MNTKSDYSKRMQAYFLCHVFTVISVVVNHTCFCCSQNGLSMYFPPSVRMVFFVVTSECKNCFSTAQNLVQAEKKVYYRHHSIYEGSQFLKTVRYVKIHKTKPSADSCQWEKLLLVSGPKQKVTHFPQTTIKQIINTPNMTMSPPYFVVISNGSYKQWYTIFQNSRSHLKILVD